MSRHHALSEADAARLRASLVTNFFSHQIPYLLGIPVEQFMATPAGEKGIADHLTERPKLFRDTVIPWLSAFIDFEAVDILEIGSGTGASTLALAEASRSVVATDIDDHCLEVARDRLALHGLTNVRVEALNGAELDKLEGQRFDLVAYIATLEHMTYDERVRSIGAAWRLLRPGGVLCVYDTPNRLWYHDGHTALAPYFHWLPDQLAIPFAARSSRPNLAAAFAGRGFDDETTVKLARWGRGVSFHEFDLAVGREHYEVISSLQAFRRERDPQAREWWDQSLGGRFQKLLVEIDPTVPLPFYEDALNLLLRRL